ncbi:hypothetical protein C6502_03070 [Candidatus Poribacteria bacterium]|nr:MAG: hypothetical protein C6502_03070 [Candidatus Poribacteria bacterium]
MKRAKKADRKLDIQSILIGSRSQLFSWIGLFLCCLSVSNTYADDYFDSITVASNGRLTRFDRDRITVYADIPPFEASAYNETLSQSLSLWEKGTEGKLKFELTPDAAAADIRIKWAYQQDRLHSNEYIGEAMLIRGSAGFHVEIEVSLRDRTSLKPHSPETVQTALLHEIGHAIGLWGHSDDPSDAMYFASTAKAPTARDIATWTKVSETAIDTPFHDRALQALQAEIDEDPAVAGNHYLIGMIYADLGDYHLAINAFQRALELEPQLGVSSVQIAEIFQQKGIYDQAIKHYTQALKTAPSAEVFGALGTLWLLQDEFDKAVNSLQRALTFDPNSATLNQNLLAAYHLWGVHYMKTDRLSEAFKCFERGLKRFPFSEILFSDLAAAHTAVGEYEKALEIYQRVLQINPRYTAARVGMATTLNNWGSKHARNRKWAEAIACYQQALGHDPACQPARQNLGETLMRVGWEQSASGDMEGAIGTYHRLIAVAPDNAEVHNNLGVIHFRKREYGKAKTYFETALALDADYDEAHANLNHVRREWLYDLMKRWGVPLAIVLIGFALVRVIGKRRKMTTSHRL